MECLKIHLVKGGKIDGMGVDEFLEDVNEGILYLLDVDSHNGREMNFKVYDEFSGIFQLWIDAAPRKHYDVMDILVSGGNMAVVNDHFMREGEIEKILELTENVILKSYRFESIEKFIRLKGKIVITSENLAPLVPAETYVFKGGEICPWRN